MNLKRNTPKKAATMELANESHSRTGTTCAAAVREQLFRSTAQDSYNYPSERTKDIRSVIVQLDEKIERPLNEE